MPQLQFYYPRGVCVDNSFESPYFGRVYVAEATGGAASSTRTTKDGVYILNAALEDETAQGANAYTGNITWSTSGSPMRVFVGEDGLVYINDWSDAHPGVWMMNPAKPQETFAPVFSSALTKASSGLSSNNGVNVHGSIAHSYVIGTGADRKLFTFDEDYVDATATSTGNLLQYNIGTLTAPWDATPSAIIYNDIANGNLQQNGNSCISPDGRNGWWISQNRATDAAAIPSLIHVKPDGTVDFNSGNTPTLIGNSSAGAMALNFDKTQLAMGCTNEVKVYGITYDANGTPSLTQLYDIKPAAGTNTSAVWYDRAGNIYMVAYNAAGTPSKMNAFALPKASNSFQTFAPSAQLMVVSHSGVKDLEVNAVSVYPNPVKNLTTVQSQNSEIKTITVYDLNGKLVLQEKGQGLQKVLDLSNLTTGTYIIAVQTGSNIEKIKVLKK